MAPPTALEKAIHERDSTKANIDVLEAELKGSAENPLTEAEVTHLLTMTKTLQVDLMEIHKRIISTSPADMDPHQTVFHELFRKLTRLMGSYTGLKMTFPVVNHHPAQNPNHQNRDIKLPRLELPTFNGNLQDWVAFRDMFVTAVHNNPTLSKAQKFTYLKSQLKGEASRQISSMIISDGNYEIAWNQLQDRYQNDREILFAIMKKLFNQSAVQPQSAVSLRQLIDTSLECIRSLEVLNLPTDKWDAILLYLITTKMDSSSKELWEQSLKDSSIPSLKSLFEFLEQRARAIAASGSSTTKPNPKASTSEEGNKQRNHTRQAYHTNTQSNCKVCNESEHPLYRCGKFLEWSVQQRIDAVRLHHLCFNCLREGHAVAQCPSPSSCRSCKSTKHHTLLHKHVNNIHAGPVVHYTTRNSSTPTPNEFDTLLATAVVQVLDRSGQPHQARVLVDNGSNTHFVTDSFAKKVQLPKKRCLASAVGLGGSSVATSTGMTSFMVSPHFDVSISFSISRCLITTSITGKLPSSLFDHNRWSHLQNLQLADPRFHQPQDVDMLLGAEFFFAIIEGKKQAGPPNSPAAIKTSFGWLIGGGSVPLINPQVHSTLAITHNNFNNNAASDNDTLDTTLRKFWEIETTPTSRLHTPEEEAAESHFSSTHGRDENGRFIVQIPFKIHSPQSTPVIGKSLNMAIKRFHLLEKRLQQNPEFRTEYNAFMKDYESLGHMSEIPAVDSDPLNACYIPHHFVLKSSSTTTKFRVVFDASAKTSNRLSLNDTMLVGPTIQDSLVEILLRFRLHNIAFTGDIAKMYRQILVTPQDADFQRIVWREDPSKPLKHYKLQTVTYGTASAPFLACRALQELAQQSRDTYPLASAVSMRDFYVDDLMSGEPTEEDAIKTQQQLIQMMESGSFSLRKWSSNSQAVLNALPPEMRETQSPLCLETDSTVKTLGIFWNPQTDTFMFKILPRTEDTCLTKRSVLSEIAKLFDPVGWLAPVIITGKIFMQSLWKLDVGWDDKLPQEFQQIWSIFQQDLEGLNSLSINRYAFYDTPIICPSMNVPFPLSSSTKFCLAGFCDASTKAYAAVIYLCAYQDQHSSISLITSKTRVAPAKVISVPRLELCSASLLADLMPMVQKALRIPIHSTAAWTDSTVALAWIKSHPSKWKTFVANRVTNIQQQIPPESWGHVAGEDNPADCASRGITPHELKSHHLWWKGPSWLKHGSHNPIQAEPDFSIAEDEAKPPIACHILTKFHQSLIERCSSLTKLVRVTAFVFRIMKGLKQSRFNIPTSSSEDLQPPQEVRLASIQVDISKLLPLTPTELRGAQTYLIKILQQQSFPHEIKALRSNSHVSKQSKLFSLCPFIDKAGVLRVGGRLNKSPIPIAQRNPILLPAHGHITQLIIENAHRSLIHAGPQLMLSYLRQHYWILGAKNAVRSQIRKCVICTKLKAETQQQMMADLPAFRVTHARPFLKSGIDYAGPFQIRPILPRSKVTLKAYICLFVCVTTKAIHLEVVSSLSTEAFLAALRRFVSRRGYPSDLYSDCGTNFIGANNELREWLTFIRSQSLNQVVADKLSQDGIKWNFNCPGSPHFGGLWESGVKSTKHHLRRIMGNQRLTFEELTTVSTQIESILNSRPLTPESSDPNDLSSLTPGHFLIGAPLNAIPEPDLEHLKINNLSRWQLLQQMIQSFWRRWSIEYLSQLQQRPKWMTGNTPINIGDMVVIKDENLPPLQWRMGRITAVHPGSDSIIRVVTVKTSTGFLKRPVVKIVLLPVENSSTSSPPSKPLSSN